MWLRSPDACSLRTVVKVDPKVEGHVGVKGLRGGCRGHGKVERRVHSVGHRQREGEADKDNIGEIMPLQRYK